MVSFKPLAMTPSLSHVKVEGDVIRTHTLMEIIGSVVDMVCPQAHEIWGWVEAE